MEEGKCGENKDSSLYNLMEENQGEDHKQSLRLLQEPLRHPTAKVDS